MTGPIGFDDRYNEPDQLRDQVRRLLRYRWIIALGTVLGLLGGVCLALLRADQYTAVGEVVVRSTADPFSSINVSIDHQLSMATERQVALSATVAARAARALGEPTAAARLHSGLKVINPPDTQVLRFEYVSTDPYRAAGASNAFVEAYLADRKDRIDAMVRRMTTALDEQVATLAKQGAAQKGAARAGTQNQIDTLQKRILDLKARDTTGGDIVRKGAPPAHPSGPGPEVIAGLGLLGGLTLGIVLAWLLAVLEPRVRSISDAQASLGAPVLGILPGAPENGELLQVGRSSGPLTEAYRTLAFQLTHDGRNSGSGSLLVLAPREHPGTAAVAANLCAAIAETGHEVLLVDATAGTPALATRLPRPSGGADGSKGDRVTIDAGRAGRFALLASNQGKNGAGAPPASAVSRLLPEASSGKSVVVLTRALLDHADGLPVAQRVDGVLVVGSLNRTLRDDLKRVRELIGCAGGRIVGAVLDSGERPGWFRGVVDGARVRLSPGAITSASASPHVRPLSTRPDEVARDGAVAKPDAVAAASPKSADSPNARKSAEPSEASGSRKSSGTSSASAASSTSSTSGTPDSSDASLTVSKG
ncbi:hypothetical protein [Streptomyces sp. NPDC000410]|uniref:hypothetical protein n=1 Tax=Streptomyces sp. NPDC000410 TaxID=3154254 RepID=UPI003328034A